MRTLGLFLLCLLLLSCNKGGNALDEAYSYPAGWPLLALAIPNGATQVAAEKLQFAGPAVSDAQVGTHRGKSYEVYFKGGPDFATVKQQVEDALKQSGRGFFVAKEGSNRSRYVSQDKLLFVVIQADLPPEGVTELHITQLEDAASEEQDAGKRKL